eukprot:COSAG02_NODE_13660_length_1366_cov_0.850039_1_plen_279_part_00
MRRSSRAAVQTSSKATVSLRNQDLQMKAQPKQPRASREQKHDRLLDVPLTQEWLASSGQMTSRATPLASGQNKRPLTLLFRDHEQVWAKVSNQYGAATPGKLDLSSQLSAFLCRLRAARGGPPSSVLTRTATYCVGAGTTSPFSVRTKRRVIACQTTCATSSSIWVASAQVCQRRALASGKLQSMMRCRSYSGASTHKRPSQPLAASRLRHRRLRVLENGSKNRRSHCQRQEHVTNTSMGRSRLARTCWNCCSRLPWKLSVTTRRIPIKGDKATSSIL